MTTRTLDAVFAEHVWTGGYYCECGHLLNSPEGHAAHVAAEVRVWLAEVLAGEGLLEAVARSICGNDKSHWWAKYADLYTQDATAALTTVRDHLGAATEAREGLG